MKRKTLVKTHLIAATATAMTIISYFTSTAIVELTGNKEKIILLKSIIFYSLPILIVSMPTLVVTGNRLAGNSTHPDIISKKSRMKWIAINGLTLIALASILFSLAVDNAIDRRFYFFQAAELALGLTNIALIGINFRTGLKLSGRLPRAV